MMNSNEILKFCLGKGLLLDKELLNLLSESSDVESAKLIIEKIKHYTNKKVLTKEIFVNNKEKVNKIFLDFPEEKKKNLDRLKVKLGLTIEISREVSKEIQKQEEKEEKDLEGVRVLTNFPSVAKKLEVKDFVIYFRNRFSEMSNILQEHSELDKLVSIGKISGNRQSMSIIGIVSDMRVTKNKNILLEVEDLTGKMKILINKDKEELKEKAEDITLDSVLGFKGVGNKEILFVNDLIFPESRLPVRKRSNFDESVVFIGDLHFGSKLFLKENFLKFIDYLNGKFFGTEEEAAKIKYLFLAGDIITGVGNYPNQEEDLEIKDLEEQYIGLAKLLGKIDKRIKIIISPGNHDGVRLMEPQPMFDEKYAWSLYEMENVILTTNPSEVNIGAKKNFNGFNVLVYHGFSYPFYVNNIPKLILGKGMDHPEEIMKYLLKQRHLAPTHSSTQYYPSEIDPLLIRNVPDIFVSAHTHKCGISCYNNILIVSTSCWEAMTPYQEKFGNNPDHCKVPLFNLKTGAVKILDFE
jgi:DNA polymerase II small subunit